MALPRIDVPTFEITLPISKQNIKFRPFLVKEQKILLIALESNDPIINERNIKQILQNCSITDIDVDNLSMIDVEYYLLNLRARSVGEVVETKYKCENVVSDQECGQSMDVKYNILDIEVKNIESIENLIQITEDISIKMKYPDFSMMYKLMALDSGSDAAFELVINCVDYILHGDEIYHGHETPKEELLQFLESLTSQQFAKIEQFFDSLPVIEKQLDVVCPKCGFKHHIEIRGLDNFFG